MKIFKLNSSSTILLGSVIIGFIVFLPIALIETIWNSTIGKVYSDINIDFWQALILWLVVLVLLYIIGVFKFEFAIERIDSPDKDSIKKKLEELQNQHKEKEIKDEQNNIK